VGAGEFRTELGAAEPVDRFAVAALGGLASVSSARDRASIPSLKSVPLARVVSASRSSTSPASSVFPLRAAASISSGSTHMEIYSPGVSWLACQAASLASA
jgi:hypothetical protein